MTEPTRTNLSRNRRHTPRLYRTVLSIAVAALVAAWLPFSILYINALTEHAALSATAASRTAIAAGGHPAQSPTPVTTRTS